MVGEVMRENLVSLQRILDATGRGERTEAADIAEEASRQPGVGRRDPVLRPTLPDGWRAYGRTVHRGLGEVADSLRNEGSADELPQGLSRVMAACVGCHLTYRLVEREAP